MPTILDRLQHAWNAFNNPENNLNSYSHGQSYSTRPDRIRLTRGNEKTIISAIYNRIALDVASLTFSHVKLDAEGRYLEDVDSGLQSCLNLEANIDQTGRQLIQDIVVSCMDEGVVGVMPIETTVSPNISGGYEILSMRTVKIIEWYPRHVRVRGYDDREGIRRDVIVPKKNIAIIENPFYAVMNENNSTMQRLLRKLNLLDAVDEQNGSGKLDLIIQLPYVVKSETRKKQAEQRREEIEMQLKSSQYGIAYTDGTEHITQLNRSIESNLMPQIEYLTKLLFSQLCMTPEILDGTAKEETMTNYYSRTVEVYSGAIVAEFRRKFLTKTARTQGHDIMCFRDPFKLIPIGNLADLADKLTRNEIMSSNEMRQKIGMKPSNDPKADELRNKNINSANGQEFALSAGHEGEMQMPAQGGEDPQAQLEALDRADASLDAMEQDIDSIKQSDNDEEELMHYASPYYDPVKAHEYYEQHKQLKGTKERNVTLNEKGKEARQYVRQQLSEEKKANQEKLKADKESETQKMASELESKVNQFQAKLKAMTRAQKFLNKGNIKSEIANMRKANAEARARLQEQFKADYAKEAENYKSKYAEETEKIYANPEFTKAKKKSSW